MIIIRGIEPHNIAAELFGDDFKRSAIKALSAQIKSATAGANDMERWLFMHNRPRRGPIIRRIPQGDTHDATSPTS